MTRKTLIVPVLGALLIAGCGGSDLSTEDAHDTRNRCHTTEQTACLDDSQKRVIAFPNHFANVSMACDGYGHRIFETTRSQTWIYPDPTCPGYVKGREPTVIVMAGQG